MSYFKIIKTRKTPDVLLYMDFNEDYKPIVIIKVFGEDYFNEGFIIEEETIVFETIETALQFIEDYSEKSAIKLCEDRINSAFKNA